MRATVLEGPRDVRVEDVPDPVLPGPEGVIVTVERTAICGSDLHLYHDAPTGVGIRLGHEVIGTVAEAGPHVRSLKAGDRVLVSGVDRLRRLRPVPGRSAQRLPRRQVRRVRDGARPPRRAGRGHGRPVRRRLRPPHPRGRGRRRGRAADRHPPDRLPRRAARLHPARRHRGRRRAGPRRRHGAAVRRRSSAPPGSWPWTWCPSGWPGPSALGAEPIDARDRARVGPGARGHRRPGRRLGDRGRRGRRHRARRRCPASPPAAPSRSSGSTSPWSSPSRWDWSS